MAEGNVSVEFGIIYCQLCFFFVFSLNIWTFYWCQLAFWLQSREAQANIFPRDLGVALPQYQVFKLLLCMCTYEKKKKKTTLKMCVSVRFYATCLRLNILGVPDCPRLRGMYSELGGFVAGSKVEERNKPRVEKSSWFHSEREGGRWSPCAWNSIFSQGFATCFWVRVRFVFKISESWSRLSKQPVIHSQPNQTNRPCIAICFASIGEDFYSTKFPVQSKALLFCSIKVEFGQLWSRGRVCMLFLFFFIMPCDSFPRPTFNMFSQ